jgi:hypothetical protein
MLDENQSAKDKLLNQADKYQALAERHMLLQQRLLDTGATTQHQQPAQQQPSVQRGEAPPQMRAWDKVTSSVRSSQPHAPQAAAFQQSRGPPGRGPYPDNANFRVQDQIRIQVSAIKEHAEQLAKASRICIFELKKPEPNGGEEDADPGRLKAEDEKQIHAVVSQLGITDQSKYSFFRDVKPHMHKPEIVKVSFNDMADKKTVLERFKNAALHGTPYSNLYIRRDMTYLERQEDLQNRNQRQMQYQYQQRRQ